MMKKLWLSVVSGILTVALTACSGNANEPPASSAVQPSAAAQTSDVGAGHVQSVTAIGEVFGDGQKLSAVAIAYDTEIDSSSLTNTSYSVEGHTVTNVYTNKEPAKTAAAIAGSYVIIELDTALADENSSERGNGGQRMQQKEGTENVAAETDVPPADQAPGGRGGNNPNGAGASGQSPELSAAVTQLLDIRTAAGETYSASADVLNSTENQQLVVEDFQQLTYEDATIGNVLQYNLYTPKDYDANQSYPLVLFMHDASGVGGEATRTLTQGNGAIVFASQEWQTEHACFVLAPQFDVQTVNDNFEHTQEIETTISLIKDLQQTYSIDQSRIYTTGQSMGCMSSILMMLEEPDLFAGALLVAGQWDNSIIAPLANQNLWIIVCEGDTKAKPAMDEATAIWEAAGTAVSVATWNPTADNSENAAALASENSHIKYVTLEGGGHMYTWQVAYDIPQVREWLFGQLK